MRSPLRSSLDADKAFKWVETTQPEKDLQWLYSSSAYIKLPFKNKNKREGVALCWNDAQTFCASKSFM